MTSTRVACSSADLSKQRVAVLAGGRSTERQISLLSGAAIRAALSASDDGRGPAEVLAVDVQPDGLWRLEAGPAVAPTEAIAAAAADVWFLGLHGGEGEDGRVQALLAATGVAHTGTGTCGSAIAMDKTVALATAQRVGLRVPRGREVARGELLTSRELMSLRSERGWFVKPAGGGSSVGAGRATTAEELEQAIARAHDFGEHVLVEEALGGIEASVGVLDFEGRAAIALPPIEIRPHPGRFFDYEEKYSESGAEELCPAESFTPAALATLERFALLAHRALRSAGYSRSDFLVVGDEVVFLELNTLPGFTSRSLVPQEAAVIDMDYRSLCLEIAADGLRRGVRS